MMTKDDLRQLVAKALDVEPAEITDETSPATLEKWDSMAALGIILVLDEATQGNITADDAASFTSFGAIVDVARSKGILN